jgi:SAM-dependent methyltransferase
VRLPELIECLHCPYCGSGLKLKALVPSDGAARGEYGIVGCACYRYPIVDGILILRQQPGFLGKTDAAVIEIESGQFDAAFHHAFYHSSPIPPVDASRHPRSGSFLTRLRQGIGRPWAAGTEPSEGSFRQRLYLNRPPAYANYLYYRHANPSFMACVPLMMLFRELRRSGAPVRIVDLNCGIGHATFLLRQLLPDAFVLATDHDFVNLHFARRYVAPGGLFVCLDTECPLPFPDAFLDGVLCLDGLHYVRSKSALLVELQRSLDREGVIVCAHVHSARGKNVVPGMPLEPLDYARCFDSMPCRLDSEERILRLFVDSGRLDLRVQAPLDWLADTPVLTIAASRRPDLFDLRGGLAAALMDLPTALGFNPVYAASGEAGRVRLSVRWPSAELEQECRAPTGCLPETLSLETSLASRLRTRSWQPDDMPQIEALLRSFVLVHLPPAYGESSTAAANPTSVIMGAGG